MGKTALRWMRVLGLALPLMVSACSSNDSDNDAPPASANQAPVVLANVQQQAARAGESVLLDAGQSSDADGDPLIFQWQQEPGGPQIALRNADAAQARFTAPLVAAPVTLQFRVTVSDGNGGTATGFTSVRILPATPGNRAPTAAIAAPATVAAGALAALVGNGSYDADGDALSYSWVQISGPAVALIDAQAVAAAFIAPSGASAVVLGFRLTVSDGRGGSDTAETSIQILAAPPGTGTPGTPAENRPPLAVIAAPPTAVAGTTVTLNGAGSSDPDGDPLSFAWAQLAGPAAGLGGSNSAVAVFTAPAVSAAEILRFRLTVADGRGGQHHATVDLQIDPAPADPLPVAHAGVDRTVTAGAVVTLDGSASTGPVARYAWRQLAGPLVNLSGALTAQAQFTAPDVEAATTLQFELSVEDSQGHGSSDLVDVTVNPKPPALVCGQSGGGALDVVLVLDRSGSMAGSNITQVKSAAKRLVATLGSGSRSALVSFASTATLDQTLSADHTATAAAIDGLAASGGTNAAPAFEAATQLLAAHPRSGARQVIVFLTDGDSNAAAAATAAKDQGIEIFAIGFGVLPSQEANLRSQVSPPEDQHYFGASDEQSLIDAFDAISGELSAPLLAYATSIAVRGSGLLALGDINRQDFLVNEAHPEVNLAGGSASTLPVVLPGLLRVGVANSSATGDLGGEARTEVSVTAQTSLASIEVGLPGIGTLSVGAVNSSARTSASGEHGFATEGDAGTDLVRLVLLGGVIPPLELLPNRPVILPGLLELVIEERIEVRGERHAGLTVNGLRLKLLGGVGELILGQSSSGIACSDTSPFEPH